VIMKLRVLLPLLFAASSLSVPARPPMDWKSLMTMKAEAERGNPEAQYLYGLQVNVGDGIPADPAEAVKWFRQAAVSGYAEAQAALGMLYSDPNGKMFDPVEAEIWLEKAAKQGNAQAIQRLGVLLSRGAGRNRATPAGVDDPGERSAVTKTEAAPSGVAKDTPGSGLSSVSSDKSRMMDEDPETTVRWSLILSGLRGADAYVVRGYLLENGVGMMRDEAAAADAYRHAAAQGSAPAQFRVGQFYVEGRGVAPDLAEACYWLRLAAKGGSREAGAALTGLLPKLGKEELAAADRLGRERAAPVEKK
jgi:TPR repeat protein